MSGFRNASTDVPAKASTPGSHCLTSLARLAKGKFHTSLPAGPSKISGLKPEFFDPPCHTGLPWLVLAAGGSHAAGVPDTGPFNPHFVQDIGSAFLVAGLSLAARAWRPRYWPAAVAGAGFLAVHALLHVVIMAGSHSHYPAFDLFAIVLPSAAALYSAFPNQGEHHA